MAIQRQGLRSASLRRRCEPVAAKRSLKACLTCSVGRSPTSACPNRITPPSDRARAERFFEMTPSICRRLQIIIPRNRIPEIPETLGQRVDRIFVKTREGGLRRCLSGRPGTTRATTSCVEVDRQEWTQKAVVARFTAERQALARMDHPNVAPSMTRAITESGRLFF